ncbi:MAG: YolD-like family protein [Bacilli bacterium]|jgi:uncharacterized lipoprotein YehR (DUF1307 family)|nr:YolD-like family protein [Bacilli bacterium]MDD2682311.1 YolD-like family protein [Bacilli bacterium]MDD3121103.1 YolD-like family protein [Bacilli bacterium]MDD4063402.1 YolD-like family protein [Bacilli bacterium]MDD4482353.1 YolD-like family protein [Bacilli bacterium]
MQNKKKVDRAKQFLPFEALKGFREALREKEKVIVPKIILSKEEAEILSNKIKQIKKNEIITVIFYSEGSYIELEGMVSKVDFNNKNVTIVKTEILFSNLLDVRGNSIKDPESDYFSI